ncbi:hypothetical protein BGX27_004536 [Mortierella sp. AM989]|nr:hypothetical protein BGX27_004536 [Mortierella sp. AM989]
MTLQAQVSKASNNNNTNTYSPYDTPVFSSGTTTTTTTTATTTRNNFDYNSFYSSIPTIEDDASYSSSTVSDNDLYAGIASTPPTTTGSPTYSQRSSSYNYSNNSSTDLNNNYGYNDNDNYYNSDTADFSYSNQAYLTPEEQAEVNIYNTSLGSRNPMQVVAMSNQKLNNDMFSSRSLSIHRRILVKNLLALLYTINPTLEWIDENEYGMDYYDPSEEEITNENEEIEEGGQQKMDSSLYSTIGFSNGLDDKTNGNNGWVVIDEDDEGDEGGHVVQVNQRDTKHNNQKRSVEAKRRSWKENATTTPTTTTESTMNQVKMYWPIDVYDWSASIAAFPVPPSSPPSGNSSLPRPRSMELPQSFHTYLSTVFDVDWSVALSSSEDSLFTLGSPSSSSASSSLASSLGSFSPSGSPLATNPNRRSRSSLSMSSTPWEAEITSATTSNSRSSNTDNQSRDTKNRNVSKSTSESNSAVNTSAKNPLPPPPPEKDQAWLNSARDMKPLIPMGATVSKNKDTTGGTGSESNDSNVLKKSQSLTNGSQPKPKGSTPIRKSTLVPGRRSSLQHPSQTPLVSSPSKRANNSSNQDGNSVGGIGSYINHGIKGSGLYSEPINIFTTTGSTNNINGMGQEITDSPSPTFSQRKSSTPPPVRPPLRDVGIKMGDNHSSSDGDIASFSMKQAGSTSSSGSNLTISQQLRLQVLSEMDILDKQESMQAQHKEPFYTNSNMSSPSSLPSYSRNGSTKGSSHNPPQAPRHLSILPSSGPHHNTTANGRGSTPRPPIRISSITISGAPVLPPLFPTQHEEQSTPASSPPQPPSSIHIRSKSDDEVQTWSYTTFHSAISLPTTFPASPSSTERPPPPKRANTSYSLGSASKSSPVLTTASLERHYNREEHQRPLPTVPAQYQPQQQQQQHRQHNRLSKAQATQPHSIRQSYQQPPQQTERSRQPVKGLKSLARTGSKDLSNMDLPPPPQSEQQSSTKSNGDSSDLRSKLVNSRWLGAKSLLGLKLGQSGK